MGSPGEGPFKFPRRRTRIARTSTSPFGSVVLGVELTGRCRGFLKGKRFATHFDVSFLDLGWQEISDVAGDALLLLQGGFDRGRGGLDVFRSFAQILLH